jgi:hypothetical protein
MRGSPLVRAILIISILLLAIFPLWKLTHKVEALPAVDSTPAPKASVHIALTFAHAPSGFQLLHLGKVIWEAKSPGESAQKEFPMEFPKEGIDLEIKATWPVSSPLTAVRVSVTPGNGGAIEKTAWGNGGLDEVLTFRESD